MVKLAGKSAFFYATPIKPPFFRLRRTWLDWITTSPYPEVTLDTFGFPIGGRLAAWQAECVVALIAKSDPFWAKNLAGIFYFMHQLAIFCSTRNILLMLISAVLATLALIYSALINIFLRYSPLATKKTILPRQILMVPCNQYMFSMSLNFLHYKFQDFFREKWAIFVILVTESLSIITFLR